MKIAVSTTGTTLDAPIDPRFGRTKGFIVADTETGEFDHVPNTQNLSLPQGAGLQTAQTVAEAGAGAVITGHVGPKAYMALSRGGIKVYLADAGSVGQALEALARGELSPAEGADKPGHW
jgi:predicted Fe-Mo cluster-binding NifX family protein